MIFTLPRKTMMLWQIQAVFVIAFLCLLIFSFVPVNYRNALLLVLFVLGGITVLVYLPILFKNYKITLNQKSLVINKGFIFKSSIIILKERITVIKYVSTPIRSFLKLKIIIIKTPGDLLIIPAVDQKLKIMLLKGITNE